jgi:type II secretory pathway pseudopilin PulG
MSKNLLIAIAVLTALLGLASFGLYKQVQKNGKLSVKLELKQAQIKAGEELIAKERKLIIEANYREQQTAKEHEAKYAEFKKLTDCINNRTCGVVVRNYCPNTVPSSTASGSRTSEANAPNTRQLEQDYLHLIEQIGIVEVNYVAMQRELIARSRPDYCQPK